MSQQNFIRISDSEWEVMRVIWTNGKSDASEIFHLLSEPMNWKMATVKTLLGRLVKKEALFTEQRGKKFIYYPSVTEEEVVKDSISDLFSRICATQVRRTLTEIIRLVDLTDEDVRSLCLELAEKETVPAIQCNCLPGQCHCKNHKEKELIHDETRSNH